MSRPASSQTAANGAQCSQGSGRPAGGGADETLENDLAAAELVLAELRRHREHTPFFKVVAKGRAPGHFVSVFDGKTSYALGRTTMTPVEGLSLGTGVGGGLGGHGGCGSGCFVYASAEEAAKSADGFPRESAAWGRPRALLVVQGEGSFQIRHDGKVAFEGITPLDVMPWLRPGDVPRAAWRR